MPPKKSPQLVKGKVIGARFTTHEHAAIALLAGDQKPSTWLANLVRAELDKARGDGRL